MTRQVSATVLQILGLATLTIGVFLWSVAAGLITAGTVAIIIGFALGADR